MLHTSVLVYDIWHSTFTCGVFQKNLIENVRLDDIEDIFRLGGGRANCTYSTR